MTTMYDAKFQNLRMPVVISAILLVLGVLVDVEEIRSETEESPGLSLITAVESGDTDTVRKMLEAGAYVPSSQYGLRAYQASQQGRAKHAEIAKLMQAAFDEWWESGAFYDSLISGALTSTRESALETGAYRRSLTELLIKEFFEGFFEGLEGEELWSPITERYDQSELDLTLKAGLDALDAELQAKSQLKATTIFEELKAEKRASTQPDEIREAQELLTVLGYKPGPVDGLWGPRTSEAFQTFQSDNGLPIMDVITAQALRTLREAVSSVHGDGTLAEEDK